jgi:hypothetical protein
LKQSNYEQFIINGWNVFGDDKGRHELNICYSSRGWWNWPGPTKGEKRINFFFAIVIMPVIRMRFDWWAVVARPRKLLPPSPDSGLQLTVKIIMALCAHARTLRTSKEQRRASFFTREKWFFPGRPFGTIRQVVRFLHSLLIPVIYVLLLMFSVFQ